MRTYTPQTSKTLIYQDNVALEYCNVVRKKKNLFNCKETKNKMRVYCHCHEFENRSVAGYHY